jgi:hypothetical protein
MYPTPNLLALMLFMLTATESDRIVAWVVHGGKCDRRET